jgi:hypothetical protein
MIIIIITHKPMCSTVHTIQVMGTNTYFKNEILFLQDKIYENVFLYSVSKHLHGLKHGSLACCDCGLNPTMGRGCLSLVGIVYCQVEVSVMR